MSRIHLRMLRCSLLLALAACGGDDDNGGGGDNTCSLAAGPGTISGNATYTASVTGNGAISQIRLQTEAGVVVDNNPELPFSRVEPLTTRPALIEATGTVSSGSITIAFSTVPVGGGALETESDSCSR